jgi:nucleotide-binding universal stress UspA family protein
MLASAWPPRKSVSAWAGGFSPTLARNLYMQVLLGLDGSELSLRALDRTMERARETGDSLTVAVYVGTADEALDDLEQLARDRVASAALEADVRRIEGDPGSALVDLAATGYDRIVLGGGTVSPMGKIRLGDVVEFVLANATTTVTLVR